MIIGIDGSEAFVKDKTGVENYAFQILQNLAKIDQKNMYLIYLDPRSNQIEGEWPDNFKFKFLSWPIMWTQLGLGLQTYLDRLDLLFIPGHTLPILKNPFLKSVVTVHDLGAEYLGSMHQLKQRLYLGLMTKLQIRFANKIIAVSEATKKDLVKKIGINHNKIEVIYEALIPRKITKNDAQVDIFKQFDISKASSSQKFGLEKGNYFLFVGTIQPRKNLINLINDYDSRFGPFEDAPKLIIAGKKGWLSEPIYNQVKVLSLEDKVKFVGRVNDQELIALYKNAIAFVYPSLYEGFGLPILEAFSLDCPVIAADSSSIPEVGGDAVVYVHTKDAGSIGAGMSQFLITDSRWDQFDKKEIPYQELTKYKINHKKRQEMIKKGRVQLKKFSWDKAARETLGVFREVGE